jgi:ActR/RegA family two-component response regulator
MMSNNSSAEQARGMRPQPELPIEIERALSSAAAAISRSARRLEMARRVLSKAQNEFVRDLHRIDQSRRLIDRIEIA